MIIERSILLTGYDAPCPSIWWSVLYKKLRASVLFVPLSVFEVWHQILEIISFIHQWLYSPLLGPGLFFSSVTFFTQTVGLLGRVINPSQGLYLHTEQHKYRINAHNTDIHPLSRIRTHDPSVPASEDSSCLRPRSHSDRLSAFLPHLKDPHYSLDRRLCGPHSRSARCRE
jgi:hypothetical protein